MRSIFRNIRKDFKINSKVSAFILLFYRMQHYLYLHRYNALCNGLGGVKSLFYFLLRVDAQISYKAEIGERIKLPHRAMGVVISPQTKIGNDVIIFHQVTLGVNGSKSIEQQRIEIGDKCVLSTGCKVISCKVADNCRVAPNAVVYRDVPPNTLIYSVNEMRQLQKNA